MLKVIFLGFIQFLMLGRCMLPCFTFLKFFFKHSFCVPSKTTRPLTSKKASGLSQLAVEVQGSLFLPMCQHNYFFLQAQCKTTKTTCSRWKKSDIIWHLPRMARPSPEEKKPSASKKCLWPHLSIPLPLRSTVMCPARLRGDSSGGTRGERARGNTVECAGEKKGGSQPSKWLWKVFFSSSLTRHLELSFVSRVWVYTTVLLGQPTCQTKYKKRNHTHIGESKEGGRETEQVQDVLLRCS